MIAYLMQFRLKVKYIEGCKNAPADALSRTLEDMSPETRLEFAPEMNMKDDFIITITDDELHSEQASENCERERVSYTLTPSCSNRSPSSDRDVVNQSTADVDRIAETSDTMGATILQEIVAAVNGGQMPPRQIMVRMRIMQM